MILSASAYFALRIFLIVTAILAVLIGKLGARAAIHNDDSKQAAAFAALFFAALSLGVYFQDFLLGDAGNDVWKLKPAGEAVVIEKARLFGEGELTLSNGAVLKLKEDPRSWTEGGITYKKGAVTTHLINDSDTELFADIKSSSERRIISSTVPARGAASFENDIFADRVEKRATSS